MSIDFSILDQLFEAIIVVDSKKEIIHYNHFLSTLSKLPPRKLKKIINLDRLYKSVDGKIDSLSHLDEVIKTKKPYVSKEGEILFLESQEVLNVVLKVIPFQESYVLCFNNLSIEKNLFDKYKQQVIELKDSYKQLVHADKLKSIGELTAGISHEISNPLTIASGSTEVLEIFLETDTVEENKEEVFEAIENIQSALLRINKITLNMKKFVYQDDERKEYIKLSTIIQSSINLVQSSFEKEGVELEFIDLTNELIAFVNELGVEQVLVNLFKNSLDASRDVDATKVIIELDSSNDGESIYIRVKDFGSGISSEIVDDIFNPFFTTKDIGEGTGMGLSLSKQIIESHQGQLAYCLNDPQGSVFTIELPGVELSSYLENESSASNLENTSDIKVLVIDNEVSVLNLFSSLFKDDKISIIGSSRPHEALKLLEKIDVDIIIADYNMPEMNATELSTLIRTKMITSPIIYLTSKDFSSKFKDDKSSLNISSLILKPFTKQTVLDAIKIAHGRSHEDL
jgi:signal transduction histidine kinase/CheY-like chemotaxis protein